MVTDLKQVKIEAENSLKKAKTLADLQAVYKKYLDKKGKFAQIFASIAGLPVKEKKKVGKRANLLKKEIEERLAEKSRRIRAEQRRRISQKEKIDVTAPGKRAGWGHLHPLTLVQRDCCEIFKAMGFEIIEGPEIETEWYNFDALNIPKDHPARDMWDTFWLKSGQKKAAKQGSGAGAKSGNLLLRTHTSPMQVRYMESHRPPLRIVVPGRVFRHEATDATHEANFYQLEGLMVGKDISAGNFKAIIEKFLQRFFKTEVKVRLRPSFFPFTEPSFEIDVKRGAGDWLELMGAGMVHQNVFAAAGYQKGVWQGFAFGVGIDRLAMVKYKIPDIRLLYQNDLRFLKQF